MEVDKLADACGRMEELLTSRRDAASTDTCVKLQELVTMVCSAVRSCRHPFQ
jgi:hypothetical protein